jgi:trans-2-enoyl-CoA reductase
MTFVNFSKDTSMQHVELKSFGLPWEVCKTVDGPELGSPSIDEVNLRIDAAPINPAEILIMEGKYASKPPSTRSTWH